MKEYVDIISTLGFPMVIACVGIAYILKTSIQREQKFFDQINGFQNAMSNFNDTLLRIDTRLQNLERGKDNE